MLTCYECGKMIKGKCVHYVPTVLMIQLTGDFPKAFHPKCYKKAEERAAKELHKENK